MLLRRILQFQIALLIFFKCKNTESKSTGSTSVNLQAKTDDQSLQEDAATGLDKTSEESSQEDATTGLDKEINEESSQSSLQQVATTDLDKETNERSSQEETATGLHVETSELPSSLTGEFDEDFQNETKRKSTTKGKTRIKAFNTSHSLIYVDQRSGSSFSFNVETEVKRLSLSIISEYILQFRLKSPSGEEYNEFNATLNEVENTQEIIVLDPEVGVWVAEVVVTETITYTAVVKALTSLQFKLYLAEDKKNKLEINRLLPGREYKISITSIPSTFNVTVRCLGGKGESLCGDVEVGKLNYVVITSPEQDFYLGASGYFKESKFQRMNRMPLLVGFESETTKVTTNESTEIIYVNTTEISSRENVQGTSSSTKKPKPTRRGQTPLKTDELQNIKQQPHTDYATTDKATRVEPPKDKTSKVKTPKVEPSTDKLPRVEPPKGRPVTEDNLPPTKTEYQNTGKTEGNPQIGELSFAKSIHGNYMLTIILVNVCLDKIKQRNL